MQELTPSQINAMKALPGTAAGEAPQPIPEWAVTEAAPAKSPAGESLKVIEATPVTEPLWQVYNCGGCGRTTHHAIRHQGVTPFMVPCSCGGRYISKGRTTKRPEEKAKFEWYMPGPWEQARITKGARKGDLRAAATLDHLRQGGLSIREIGQDTEQAPKQVVNFVTMPGRNQQCPCGSGEKFKRCCGNPSR